MNAALKHFFCLSIALCRHFEKGDVSWLCKQKRLFLGNFSLGTQIRFISNKYKEKRMISALFGILIPRSYGIVKRFLIAYIIDQKGANNTSIVRSSYWPVVFLASRIPYLKSYVSFVQNNFFVTELYSDCRVCIFVKLLIDILVKQAWFSNRGIANENHFKQIIVGWHLL